MDQPQDTNIPGLDLSGLSSEGSKIVSLIIGYFEKVLKSQELNHEKEITALTKRIEALEDKNDALENYTRRESLVISADSSIIRPNQNSIQTVCDLVSSELNVPLNTSDISVAHPLPDTKPKNGSQPKKRIIFKLVRRDLKPVIFKACAEKKPPFSINESISPTRSTIMYVLRKAREDFPRAFGRCRSEDGSIKLWLPKTDDPESMEKITCNTRSKLEELLRVKANITSKKYSPRWPK